MLYLNHPPIQRLITALPASDHSVAVAADFWHEPCQRAGLGALHDTLFAGRPEVRITRSWLHRSGGNEAQLRTLAILLWGYPKGARGNRHQQWLAALPEITAAAASPAPGWEEYHGRLTALGGLGISTISKLAFFWGQAFAGRPALILDQRIIGVCAAGRWTELAPLRDLAYPSALRRYPDYLAVMHAIAATGGFSAEQLELFLFALGDAF